MMKIIYLLLLSIIRTGCTTITVPTVIGTQITTDKELEEIYGTWRDADRHEWEVKKNTKELPLLIVPTANQKNKESYEATISNIDDQTKILWLKDNKSNSFIPFRMIQNSGDPGFTLLYPDEKEVRN